MSTDRIDPALIERAREADILAVAQRLGATLRKAGGNEFVGPCPKCGSSGPRSNRFSVNTNKQVWHCRGCKPADVSGDVIGLVRHLAGVGFIEALEILAGAPSPRLRPAKVVHAPTSQRRQVNTDFLRWWDAADPIFGKPTERYLTIRNIDIEQIPDLDSVLRFHSRCIFGKDLYRPCLLALIRDIKSNVPIGIVRTSIDEDGHKAPIIEDGELVARKTLGSKQGGAVKLWGDGLVTYRLIVGEGVETVAAAATRIKHNGLPLHPAWSLVDAGNLATMPPLKGIETLIILVDNDLPDKHGRMRGQDAARECLRRQLAADYCDVELLTPNEAGDDFADIVANERQGPPS